MYIQLYEKLVIIQKAYENIQALESKYMRI